MNTNRALVFVVAGILAAGQAVADKPSWAGSGKGKKSEQREQSENAQGQQRNRDERSQRDRAGPGAKAQKHFGDQHRTVVHEYYNDEFRRGRCPPGLAKKHNGCMPPGLAKKWTVGRPLPRDVVFYNLPPALVTQFGPAPDGNRYVRVANDILLIAPRTGTVIDAILNLGRL